MMRFNKQFIYSVSRKTPLSFKLCDLLTFIWLIHSFFQSLQKKQKDKGGPKRPMSAYMLWLNASRERIKSENPGISITEISKKAGEMWRQIGKEDKEVRE